MGGKAITPPKAAPIPELPDAYCQFDNNNPRYTCEADDEIPPRIAAGSIAGPGTPPKTMVEMMEAAAAKAPDHKVLFVERPIPAIKDGNVPPALPIDQWTTWTYKEFCADVRLAAGAFISLGLNPYESVSIWGFNAPEWHISAMAAMYACAKPAGLYPTDTPDTAAYKVVHSSSSILVLDSPEKVTKLRTALDTRGDCVRLKVIVGYSFEPEPAQGEADDTNDNGAIPLLGWPTMLQRTCTQETLNAKISLVKPGFCSTLIYTSGTTGDPKAVMLSHDALQFQAVAVLGMFKSAGLFAGPNIPERILSYLPLSHIAGFLLDVVTPFVGTATTSATASVYYARPYDLGKGCIKDRLLVARPTGFLGVPLVWEKIADKIRSLGANVTGMKRKIANMAKTAALTRARNMQIGGTGKTPANYTMMKKLALSKISARLGLDKCKVGLTGAAPIRVDTMEFFASLGIIINEVYGMSESCGPATGSTPGIYQWGSVGFELPGMEVKAFSVDAQDFNKKTECPKAPSLDCLEERFQGELCFRGRSIMMGYLANPDLGPEHDQELQKKTSETIDDDGWLHSGDKGMITVANMVKITGRFKELIIGEGGENIAPVPIEDMVKNNCDGINEVIMTGDKRKYCVALVTLKAVGANGEVPGTDQLDAGAVRVNPKVTTISEAINDQVWIDAIHAAIKIANSNGKCCPNNASTIKKFTILRTNFSEECGELTPTKKVKRKVVEQTYANLIEEMYAASVSTVYVKHVQETE